MKNQIKFRIFLFFFLTAMVSFFLYKSIVPGGYIVYFKDFQKDNYFIEDFSPETRVSGNGEFEKNILTGEPVYFNIRSPRTFKTVNLHYEYKNVAEAPFLETGILIDGKLWRHRLAPLENRFLDQLSLVWDGFYEKGNMLLIRPEIEYDFNNIEDFLNDPPDYRKIAVYNYDFENDFVLEDYEPDRAKSENIPSLRGAYQFFTYLKDEDLDLVFSFKDLNLDSDPDPILVNLYLNDDLIDFRDLEDDGIVEENGETSELRTLEFNLKNLPEGAYKVELRAGRDVITEKIETGLSKISFINKIELHQAEKNGIDVYSDSRELQFTTIYPDALQTVKINGNDFEIKETYTQHRTEISSTASGTQIRLQKDGIIISGNGVFGFWPGALLNPRLRRADYNLDVNRDGIDYVIAGYRVPEKKDGWNRVEIEFDLSSAYRENGRYGFIISAPGLNSSPGIIFNSIKAEFRGVTLYEKLRAIIF